VNGRLRQAGLTAAQVQVVWFEEAHARPQSTGPVPNDIPILQSEFESIIGSGALLQHFPNVKLLYASSRSSAYWANSPLNPEPYAYDSGFAVKGMIQDQINGMASLNFDPTKGTVQAPWMAWARYFWADGPTPNYYGLSYVRSDYGSDGTHPSQSGAN